MLLSPSLFGQVLERSFDELSFRSLKDELGESLGQINALIEGPSGFIWIGSSSGLHRYDGYQLSSYVGGEGEGRGIADSVVWILFLDGKNRLWVGTQNGLSRYVEREDRFVNYRLNREEIGSYNVNRCSAINEDEAGNIYAATSWGMVYRFDEIADSFEPVSEPLFSGIKSMEIATDGSVWLGSLKFLAHLDLSSGTVSYYHEGIAEPDSNSKNSVVGIEELDAGKLLVATSLEGMFVFDPDSGAVETLPQADWREKRIQQVYRSASGRTWVSHGNGITLLDGQGAVLGKYATSSRPDALPSGSVRSTYEDRQGNVWAGTLKHGIFLSENGKGFRRYYPEMIEKRVGIDPVVSQIMWDSLGRKWIGYYEGGVDVFLPDGTLDFILRHDEADPSSIGRNGVYVLYQDRSGSIWVGTYSGGMRRFEETSRGLVDVFVEELGERSLGRNDPRAMIEDDSGNLWVMFNGAGLVRYNYESGAFKRYVRDRANPHGALVGNWGTDLAYSKRGFLYVATNRGLSVLDLEADVFRNYLHDSNDSGSLSDTACSVLFVDSKNRVWVGTKEGLNLFDEESQAFRRFSVENGMPSRQIRSIQEDETGSLWVGTDAGLARIDAETFGISSYNASDGLMHDEFFRGAAAKSADGWLYFGQTNGITYFDPSYIKDNPVPPRPFIGDVKLFYDSMPIDPSRELPGSIPMRIDFLETLELTHRQKVLSISFAALNYIETSKNQYAYRLDGFDEDWLQVGARREANYTNLNPGVYTFRVKASNNDGYWSEEEARLRIVVEPPHWRRPWFYLVVVLAAACLIYGFERLRERRLRRRQRQLEAEVEERTRLINTQKQALEEQRNELETSHLVLEERVEQRTLELFHAKEKAEEADRLKSTFLANLSHEIRTPLNAIVGFTALMAQRVGGDKITEEFSSIVTDNSKALLRLIDDILDYSMIAAKQVQIEEEAFDLSRFVELVIASHRVLPRSPEVALRYENKLKTRGLKLFTDQGRLRQIIDNLLTNASKFTKKGHVLLGVERVEDRLCIYVEDTGEGIDPKFQAMIFEQFYQLPQSDRRSQRGVGLGLAISKRLAALLGGELELVSELGKGSCFKLWLPWNRIRVGQRSDDKELSGASVDFSELSLSARHRILVIEDEELNYRYLVTSLEATNAEISGARTGEEGVAAYRDKGPFDLVLLDIKLPGIDGFETLKQLRECDPRVVVIAQTAYSMNGERARIVEAGFSDYLPKPISLGMLGSMLKRYLVDQ